MEGTRLCIRDGVIPGNYRCPICGDGFILVGHDPVVTLVSTTHPVCEGCFERLAPRLSAVVALWKSATAEKRRLLTPPNSSKDDSEQSDPPADSDSPTAETTIVYSELHEEEDGPNKASVFFGPGHIESGIRQSIQMCWMSLPANRRNLDEVEKQVRRIVDRVFKNLREDEQALAE